MNYVLVAINQVPEYLKFTVNSILSVDDSAKVFLLSDSKTKFKNITQLNIQDINSQKIDKIAELDIYKNTIFQENPLWQTSLLRVFYLEEIFNTFMLDQFIHFDNDVILYKPYKEIKENFIQNKINITKPSQKKCVFGYSFFGKQDCISEVCNEILKIAETNSAEGWDINNAKPYSEMDFLGKISNEFPSLFNILPTVPYKSEIVFDPSSYGQFLDGTHMHPKKFYSRKYINLNEFVGTEISSKRMKVNFSHNKPAVTWNKKKYELVNLHIHSKRFEKFLPENYYNWC